MRRFRVRVLQQKEEEEEATTTKTEKKVVVGQSLFCARRHIDVWCRISSDVCAM